MNEMLWVIQDILNQETFKDDSLKQLLKNALQQSENSTNAQTILNLCNVFTQKVMILRRKNTTSNSNNQYYKRRKRNTTDEQEQEIFIFGAQLVYLLRTFFTGEEMGFHIGVKGPENKYSNSAYISQDMVLQNLQALKNGKSKFIGLSKTLESQLVSLQTVAHDTPTFIDQWKIIEDLAYVDKNDLNGYDDGEVIGKDKKTKRAIYAYQKMKPDTSVFISYTRDESGKPRERSLYYGVNNPNKPEFSFNLGWLWEWYGQILNGGTEEQNLEVQMGLKQETIRPLMQSKDNISGIRQGDYQDRYGIQIQSKYYNQKLISYNSIINIIGNIKAYLLEYISATKSDEVAQKMTEYIRTTFMPKELENISPIIVQKIDDEILNQLSL